MNRTIEDILKACDAGVLVGNNTTRELCEAIESLQGKIDELRDALEHLMDEQYGPTLPANARHWHRAMEVACKALGRKAGEKHHREAQESCCSTTPS
jgi:hypothetical protein